ncbi:hypothetical protein WJX81_007916 [Elliptochloris bilobata]|uniref:Protein kinase domain-containing protein n=1 Tax=Elliptochloris bilobata TaxID=381761 RepID=A0AAW1RMC5_9CHLO
MENLLQLACTVLGAHTAARGPRWQLPGDIFAVEDEAHVSFYVGAPLTAADGSDLGMLCVADSRPLHEGANAVQEEGQELTRLWDIYDLADDCMAPWERFASALERGEEFVVRKARLRDLGGGLTCGEWDYQFRLVQPDSPLLAEAAAAWARAARACTRSMTPNGSMELPVFPGLELGKLFGQGSYGRVYRGTYSGRTIAVKMVENTTLLRMQNVQPLEAVIMAGLVHSCIVHTIVHSVVPADGADCMWDSADSACIHGQAAERKAQLKPMAEARNGHAWLLLEYTDRGSLQEAIQHGAFLAQCTNHSARPNVAALLTTAAEIAGGMAFLHARGIIHGDLSGANVLLQSRASASHGFCTKISDFGLARNMACSRIETDSLWTVTRMPPELLADGLLSKAVDCVLLWEMYNSKRAWDGLSQAQIVYSVAIKLDCLLFAADAHTAVATLSSE